MHVDSEYLAIQCIKAAVCVSLLLTAVFWGAWFAIFVIWLLTFPLAMLIAFVTGAVLHSTGATMDTPQVWGDEDVHILDSSDEIVGRFKDHDIHEWIVIKRPDTGEAVKLTYECCVNLDGDFDVPNLRWFAIIDGGVMYTEPEPENVVSESAPTA